jgi:glycosyltransferase involved in cell wall biosynthesis
MTNQTHSLDLSLVIPLFNEEESLQELVAWIAKVCEAHDFSYEVLLVDDGSKDKSWSVIRELSASNKRVKGIRFRRNYGKSAALNAGFEQAQGEVVITMDADLQDSPDEIPGLVEMIRSGNDLVSGWKQKRYDPITKTVPTRLFNWATRKMSGIHNLHDFNCGLKAYRYEVVKNIEVYGEMHRYIPVIAKWAGFNRIAEKVVQHSPRKYGTTKFGLERFVNGFLDLLSITFVSRFGKRPMHFFGLLGTVSFLAGFGIAVKLAVDKYFFQIYNMTDRPLFFFGMLAMILGTQLFLAGFLGEMIARNAPDRNRYQVSESTNI